MNKMSLFINEYTMGFGVHRTKESAMKEAQGFTDSFIRTDEYIRKEEDNYKSRPDDNLWKDE